MLNLSESMAPYGFSNFRTSDSATQSHLFGARDSSFYHWFHSVRLSRIILCILIVLVSVPIVTHYYLSNVGSENSVEAAFRTRTKLDLPDELALLKAGELKLRIDEMQRIKISVNNELRDLEAKRQKLQSEIASFGQKIEDLKMETAHKQNDLERIQLSINQAEVAHREILEQNQPELKLPTKLSNTLTQEYVSLPSSFDQSQCTIYSCIDFSRCSLISGFPVYVYPLTGEGLDERISASLAQTFSYNPHVTISPTDACVYIYVNSVPLDKLQETLIKLPYWAGDGRNHIILNFASSTKETPVVLSAAARNGQVSVFGRSMIVQTVFNFYRSHFDLLVPPLFGPPGSDVWEGLPSLTPARRRYLRKTFSYEYLSIMNTSFFNSPRLIFKFLTVSFAGRSSNNFIEFKSSLEQLQGTKTSDEFFFEFQCNEAQSSDQEMALCGSDETRAAILKQSTFVLIHLPTHDLTTYNAQVRLFEALKYGAVPIVLGDHSSKFIFPYEDVVDWSRALIQLPLSRLPELHFLARSVTDRDILALRRNARIFWEKYFGSVQSIVDSIIAVYRQRIGVPAPAILDEPSPSVFNDTFTVTVSLTRKSFYWFKKNICS